MVLKFSGLHIPDVNRHPPRVVHMIQCKEQWCEFLQDFHIQREILLSVSPDEDENEGCGNIRNCFLKVKNCFFKEFYFEIENRITCIQPLQITHFATNLSLLLENSNILSYTSAILKKRFHEKC